MELGRIQGALVGQVEKGSDMCTVKELLGCARSSECQARGSRTAPEQQLETLLGEVQPLPHSAEQGLQWLWHCV